MTTPIFLLSLPRSGSTLLQRILATSSEIATASEPWVALPILYSLKRRGVMAEYGHRLAVDAIADFYKTIPGGRETYIAAIREFLMGLYAPACRHGERYFLDKTPRYYLVVDELLEAFPDAKFIVLWRNPLAVIASLVSTYGSNRWVIHRYASDLYDGVINLTRVCEQQPQRFLTVRYEDLVTSPEAHGRRIFQALAIQFDEASIRSFGAVKLTGAMGDPKAEARSGSIDASSLNAWQNVLRGSLRKFWCRKYLHTIGQNRWTTMGYDLHEMLRDVDALPATADMFASDAVRMPAGAVIVGLKRLLLQRDLPAVEQ